MECGHLFCLPCWRGHVKASIYNGPSSGNSILDIHCPGQNSSDGSLCALLLNYEAVEALLAGEKSYSIYLSSFVRSFVGDNTTFSWCPNPAACGRAIAHDDASFANAKCFCGYFCCMLCKRTFHSPVSCKLAVSWEQGVEKYLEKKKAGGESGVVENVKPCPNPDCNIPTTKTSGCMHLVCAHCKCEWCWQCGNYGGGNTNRQRPHHVYNCNEPRNENWNSIAPFEDDGRFNFYYERFLNHTEAQKLADSKRKSAKKKTENILSNFHTITSSEAEFVAEAYELLIVCRNVLAWTYVSAYFIRVETDRIRFQYIQGEFERYVEDFSRTVEENDVMYLLQHRLDITNTTKALTKFLGNIMRQ